MSHTTKASSYRYGGKRHQHANELATRLVDVGVELFSQEGLTPEQARAVMRGVVGQVFGEWGADTMYVPKEFSFDGLTQRDRDIWAAWQGTNKHELCKRFGLSPRMLAYVLDHCRRWHRERTEPQLPLDVPPQPGTTQKA